MNGRMTAVGALLLMLTSVSCGKSVAIGPLSPGTPGTPNGPGGEGSQTGTDQSGQCSPVQWTFNQPSSSSSTFADILFVVDTSPSMTPKRSKIASQISALTNSLPPSVDTKIGVMLAHGGASPYSGQLFSAPGTPLVLSTATHSPAVIQSSLQQTLAMEVSDYDLANGEMLLYSMAKSLDSDHLSGIQSAGFYRPEAALGVVYVTDENDECFPPELNGFTTFPDYAVSIAGSEILAFNKYCTGPGLTASNWPQVAFAKLAALKGSMPIVLGGVNHYDPTKVPQGTNLEDAIGHGILEHLNMTPNNVKIEITAETYEPGLGALGNTVASQLVLRTVFTLPGSDSISQDSVTVQVDGTKVGSTFNPSSRTVGIQSQDAGKSGSVVVISACKA